MVRAQEYFHILEQEFNALDDARRIKLDEKMQEEVANAQIQLAELNTRLSTADEVRKAFVKRENQLKAIETRVKANANATDEQKAKAEKDLEDH